MSALIVLLLVITSTVTFMLGYRLACWTTRETMRSERFDYVSF